MTFCVFQQPGDLGVLRGVIHGFSEEARTRGFPSPPFGGFGFSYDLKTLFYVLLRMNTTETTYQRKSRVVCPLMGFFRGLRGRFQEQSRRQL